MCNETCPPNSTQHVIKAGDTFWTLSQTYGVSVQSISDLNPGHDPQNLQIGSSLCIPTTLVPYHAPAPKLPTTPVTCPRGTHSHTIRSGDTFWTLSQTYGVSVQSISDLNPGHDPQNLQIGSSLCIPTTLVPYHAPAPKLPTTPVACPRGAHSHTIRSGDTFWTLSQTYGVSVQSISDLNPGLDPQNLQIGSTLCIPVAPTPSPTPPTVPRPPVSPTPKPPTPPVTCPRGTHSHTIRSGDTFWTLSQTYGVSVQSISDLNPGHDPQNLQIGSTLCIPVAPAPSPTPPTVPRPPVSPAPAPPTPPVTCPRGTHSHTIRSGDTFWTLSQTYGVSVQSISDLNPGLDPQNLQIGSTLCIPVAPAPSPKPPTVPRPPVSPTPKPPTVPRPPVSPAPKPPTSPTPPMPPSDFAYLVQACDSICEIARKFCVSVESILRINPEINPKCLQAGTYIYIPSNCCGKNTRRYVVRAGDTLNRIANKFNVCPSDLIAANPNINFQCLVKGQVICIPSA